MTKEEIIWQIVIGLFLLGVGASLRPLFKGVWARMNKPRPLTPSEKGSLITYIERQKQELERLDHFNTHSKDLFLYLFRLATTAFLFFISAVCLYAYRPTFYAKTFPLVFVFLVVTILFSVRLFGKLRGWSDKEIDALKETIQKSIDEAIKKLISI